MPKFPALPPAGAAPHESHSRTWYGFEVGEKDPFVRPPTPIKRSKESDLLHACKRAATYSPYPDRISPNSIRVVTKRTSPGEEGYSVSVPPSLRPDLQKQKAPSGTRLTLHGSQEVAGQDGTTQVKDCTFSVVTKKNRTVENAIEWAVIQSGLLRNLVPGQKFDLSSYSAITVTPPDP